MYVCICFIHTYYLFYLIQTATFFVTVCVCVHLRRAYACKIRKCKCIVYMHVAEYWNRNSVCVFASGPRRMFVDISSSLFFPMFRLNERTSYNMWWAKWICILQVLTLVAVQLKCTNHSRLMRCYLHERIHKLRLHSIRDVWSTTPVQGRIH